MNNSGYPPADRKAEGVMNSDVFLTEDAEADIFGIWKYVARHDSVERAGSLIDALQEACLSLCHFPDQGHCPPELERIHVFEYRELHYKPHRIIYRILDRQVFISSGCGS